MATETTRQTVKARAAALTRAKEPLELLELEWPEPGPNEAVVRIEACGLGLRDWHVAMLDALPRTPLVLGCEAVGRLESTGARVGITPLATSCGACDACVKGAPHHCGSAQWHALTRNGALCERGVFATQHLVPLPDGDPGELAVLMGSGWGAAAAIDAADLGKDDSCGVFGLGGVGHLVLQLAALDAGRVVALEPDASRRSLALEHDVVEPSRAPSLDVALVCVPSVQAVHQAFAMLKSGGRLIVAAESPSGRFDLPFAALTARGITVKGTQLGQRADLDAVLRLHAAGALVPRVMGKPLAEAPAQLYALRDAGFLGRLVFIP